MRRRLLLVIVGTVTATLLVTGLFTIGLVRREASRDATRRLREQADRIANTNRARSSTVFSFVVDVLNVDAGLVLERPPGAGPGLSDTVRSRAGVDVSAAVLSAIDTPSARANLDAGRPLSGSVGAVAYVAVPSRDASRVVVLADRLDLRIDRIVRWFVTSALAALVIAALAAALIARRLTGPLRSVTALSRRIAQGDLQARVEAPSDLERSDEVGELTRSINRMADELDRSRQAERQFLLSVSHDLRTPLTSIRGFAEAIAEGTASDQQRAGTVIASESRRLERLVKDLLDLAKLEARQFRMDLRPVDVTDVVTDTADSFLPTAAREGLELQLDADADLWAVADPERLAQVIANLIENATKYARTTVRVSARREADAVEIRVGDDGPGVVAEDVPRIFDRLYTSDRRPTRHIGSGLGLAIVRELTTAMQASVHPETGPDGTTFVVRLPASPAAG